MPLSRAGGGRGLRTVPSGPGTAAGIDVLAVIASSRSPRWRSPHRAEWPWATPAAGCAGIAGRSRTGPAAGRPAASTGAAAPGFECRPGDAGLGCCISVDDQEGGEAGVVAGGLAAVSVGVIGGELRCV